MDENTNFSDIDPDMNMNTMNLPTRYYTIDEYCNLHFQMDFNLSMLNYNIYSFFAHQPNFESFLEILPDQFDVIVVSETWLNPFNFQSCHLNNYLGYHTYRTESRSGGISVFAKRIFKSNVIESLSLCNEIIESCVVRVSIGKSAIFVVGIYRPHSGTIEAFNDELERILCSPLLQNSLVLVAGDMNINLNHDSNSVLNYVTMLNSLNYFSLINNNTRFSNNDTDLHQCRSAIDHIWVNENLSYDSAIIEYGLTDHRPCIVHLKYDQISTTEQPLKTIEFRPYKDEYFEFLMWQVSNVDWNSILLLDDPEMSCNRFLNIIDDLYCLSFPLKIKKVSEKRLQAPWLNQSVKQKIKFKSQCLKNYKAGIISNETYNPIRNSVNRLVKKAKNEYYERSFDSYKTQPRKAWKLMHDLMGKENVRSNIDSITVNNEEIVDSKDIAENFIEYFSNVGNQLDSILEYSELNPCQYVKQNNNCFYLFPVSKSEIENIVMNLKLTKSSVHSLPVKLFKKLIPFLLEPLFTIINASFSTGIFPSILKRARLTPVFKSGNKNDRSNYRPISSLHYVSKIFERCMVIRLTKFFFKYDLFSKSQFGFLKGRSTADALVHLTEFIYRGLDQAEHNVNIMIDLKKAFDTVNHKILLQKMFRYGIRGVCLNWFESYLKDRECFTCINSKNSQSRFLNIGVPQGSVIGPILFLIYINDLPNLSDKVITTLYADDTTLTFSGPNSATLIDEVNSHLEKLRMWSNSNRLTINASKTEMLIITNRNFENNHVILSDEIIQPGVSCKFLGTFLDKNLDFSVHIKNTTTKVARNGGILYRIRDNLNSNARLNFYNSYVLPFLSYNIICWGQTYATHLSPLFLRQKRIIRTLTNSAPRDSTSPLFKKLGLLKLSDIFKFELLKYMFVHKNDTIFRVQHDRNLRNRDSMVSSTHRLTKTQQAVTFSGPKEWNNLPIEIRNANSYNTFKILLKTHFLQKY